MKAFLAVALAMSWAGPLCALPAAESSHACCPGGEAPAVPLDAACCHASAALPPSPAASVAPLSAAAILSPSLSALAPDAVFVGLSPASVFRAPDAPPGASSGLSPPASGR